MRKTINVPWDDLRKGLDINYSSADHEILQQIASTEANHWIADFEVKQGIELRDEQKLEAELVFLESLEDHWSLANVVSNNVDIDEIVDLLNAWSNRSKPEATFFRTVHVGDGILDWKETEDGIAFRVTDPFIVAYIEARHCETSSDDDGTAIRDLTAQHIVDTIKAIFRCEGRQSVYLDLEDWDSKRTPPTYDEVERRVEVAGRRRRSLRVAAERN